MKVPMLAAFCPLRPRHPLRLCGSSNSAPSGCTAAPACVCHRDDGRGLVTCRCALTRPLDESLMNFASTALLTMAMSTDAFAATVSKSTALQKPRRSEALRTGATR